MIYLKAKGPPEQLETVREKLIETTKTLSFDEEGDLNWETPDGWQRKPGRSFALAVLIVPTQPQPTEITVTSLAMPETNREQYLVQNYDRWRGQVDLRPLGVFSSDDPSITEISTNTGSTAYLIDLIGNGSGQMQSPPFARPGAPFASAPTTQPSQKPDATNPTSESTATDEPSIEYEAPEQWQLDPPRPFRLVSFSLPSEEGEVIVSTASSPINTVVQMWQEQITPGKSKEDLSDSVQTVIDGGDPFETGGRSGVLYIIGESDSEDSKVIMTAVSPIKEKPDSALYVKFIGTRANAQAYKSKILKFVGTIRLPEEQSPKDE